MKVVNKIIANRVKFITGDLMGECQMSFVPGRQVVENVVIVQELIHSLNRTKGKK